MIKCNVIADVADMRGKSVLVLLQPMRPLRNMLIHAWQVLDLSAHASASFYFDPVISAKVSITRASSGNIIRSASENIAPGVLLQAVRPGGLSPKLEPCADRTAIARLTPKQSGIYNRTNPPIPIDCCWQVGGNPVASVLDVDWGMTSTFEYTPALHFLITEALQQGDNYTAQAFTGSTPYVPALDTSVLNVHIRRERDRWSFTFVPDWGEG